MALDLDDVKTRLTRNLMRSVACRVRWHDWRATPHVLRGKNGWIGGITQCAACDQRGVAWFTDEPENAQPAAARKPIPASEWAEVNRLFMARGRSKRKRKKKLRWT